MTMHCSSAQALRGPITTPFTLATVFTACFTTTAVAAPPDVDITFISKFGQEGSRTGQFIFPTAVTVDDQGRIFISEDGTDRIQACDYDGICEVWAISGTGSGQFMRPRDSDIDLDGNLVIADRDNHRVQVCSAPHQCTAFGEQGSSAGQFVRPTGIAIDPQNRIVIAETGWDPDPGPNTRIQVCDHSGNCTVHGALGTGAGEFSIPRDVDIDGDGHWYITEIRNHRFQVCEPNLVNCVIVGGDSCGSSIGEFCVPRGIAADPRGFVWVADSNNNRVQACNLEGECVAFGSLGTGDGDFWEPHGIALDREGRLIVTEDKNHRIQIFDTGYEAPPEFHINQGLNDAWFNSQTDGQGFFINVFTELELMFVAWFTFETDDDRPPQAPPSRVGEPYHRWLTGIGGWEGNTATIDVVLTTQGVFDDPAEVTNSDPETYGTITIEFHDCGHATLTYDLYAIGLSGEMPIRRIVQPNNALCEVITGEG